jgi:hypothetical protein
MSEVGRNSFWSLHGALEYDSDRGPLCAGPPTRPEPSAEASIASTTEARSSAQRAGHRRLGAVIVERQLGQRLARGRDPDLFG